LLREPMMSWAGCLSRLMLKAFDPATNDNPILKACLVKFIPVFVEWSRDHQMLLVEAFPETFDALRSDSQFEGALQRINVDALGSCFMHAKGSVQPFLCSKILSALGEDPEDDYASVFCRMLGNIDTNDWMDVAQIKLLITDTEDIVDLYSETEATRGYIRALTSFAKKLRNRVATLEAFISTQMR
uniref:Cnd3 domain-containing protein n=1 Tax=Gongylonema pulchrum TaxID=637853 RepID=A0A183CZG5_9BILA